MSPNKDETAVHGCSSYLHCSYSGEAGFAYACRFWSNRGVEFEWFVLSTVPTIYDHVVFVLDSAMKAHLSTNKNPRIIQIIL